MMTDGDFDGDFVADGDFVLYIDTFVFSLASKYKSLS